MGKRQQRHRNYVRCELCGVRRLSRNLEKHQATETCRNSREAFRTREQLLRRGFAKASNALTTVPFLRSVGIEVVVASTGKLVPATKNKAPYVGKQSWVPEWVVRANNAMVGAQYDPKVRRPRLIELKHLNARERELQIEVYQQLARMNIALMAAGFSPRERRAMVERARQLRPETLRTEVEHAEALGELARA